MKIGLAQINTIVGDLEGNVRRSIEAVFSAHRQEADLVVLPEMTIPGYPPRDILFDPSFIDAVQAATADLAMEIRNGPPVLAGTLWPSGFQQPHHPGLWNTAVLLEKGEVKLAAAKQLLPIYDVFHEPRWFTPGPALPPLDILGQKIGVLICEDMWNEGYQIDPGQYLREAGATMFICVSASPFRQNKLPDRLFNAQRQQLPIVYLNLVGATDELIFDGHSFILNDAGQMVASLPGFQEMIEVIDMDKAIPIKQPDPAPEPELFGALSLGIRDFGSKNGLKHAFLGLSGGIDSALTAVLAAEALGPKNVTGVAIPSRYSDPRSTDCARELADNLDIGFEVVELEALHKTAESTLAPWLNGGNTAENIQARLRAMILMAFVNARSGFLLNTSNKSELALGYGTLYGDMAGALCPIADLTKPDVYRLSRWINEEQGLIPDFIIDRPPSAELSPDQVDPFDYEAVAPALEALILQNLSNGPIRRSEHKRWQMGVILKVSDKAFGSGRFIPITRR